MWLSSDVVALHGKLSFLVWIFNANLFHTVHHESKFNFFKKYILTCLLNKIVRVLFMYIILIEIYCLLQKDCFKIAFRWMLGSN